MTTPGAVTQNQLNVTLQAYQDFEGAIGQLNSISEGVGSASQQLTTAGMVDSAGARFGNSLDNWNNDFQDIKNALSMMATQLNDTADQLRQNLQNNTEMAASMPTPGPTGLR